MDAGSVRRTLGGECLAVDGEAVTFRFGGKKSKNVLDALDISVKQGVIYGLLGPSGCGKTTLLQCIVGRHRPNSGHIRIFGKLPGQKGFSVPGPGVGFMPQELALYPEISMEETLTFFGRLYQMNIQDIRDRIEFLAKFLDIPDKKKQVKHLSGGQQRRVSFAAALIHKPPLLILDEPTVGVDPLLRKSIWNHLFDLAVNDGITIMITTHYVEEARQAHVVGLMRAGRLLAESNPENLIKRYQVETLEDVFLKLCVSNSRPISGEFEYNADEEASVWIPRKVMKPHNKYTTMTSINHNNPEQFKTALLDNSSGNMVVRNTKLEPKGRVSSAWNRFKALNAKNFVRLRRNIPLVFFQLFIPAFQVIVFCLCVGGTPFDLNMAVVNLETDPSGYSGLFLQTIDPHTIRQKNFTSLSLAIESVERGENWGVVYIGPVFTDSMINRYLEGVNADNETINNSTIKIFLDMTNQQIAATIYAKIMSSFEEFSEKMLKRFHWNPAIATPPAVLGTPIYGNRDPNFTEYMAPGMVLGITYMMAVGLSAMSIIIEKKEGLLNRSLIAGVSSWEVIFSILFSLFVVMLVQVAIVLALTFEAFSIPYKGPIFWVVIAVLLVGLEGMAYGLFISSIVDDENIAVMIAMGSFYPTLLLSGIIWPIQAMPHYLRYLSYCLPLTFISRSMRSILSRGWGIADNHIWDGYLVCLAWIFPVILIASFFFKYKK